jgi:hypothetical protein
MPMMRFSVSGSVRDMGPAFVRYQDEEAGGVRVGEAPGDAPAAGMVDLKAIAFGRLRERF